LRCFRGRALKAQLEVPKHLRAVVAANSSRPAAASTLKTCSVGWRVSRTRHEPVETGWKRRIEAMYAAKELGRNQIRSFADPIVDNLDSDAG